MAISGKAWKFGDDVNTDLIIAARYLNLAEASQLAEHLMEDADPDFPSKVGPGDIIVAGKKMSFHPITSEFSWVVQNLSLLQRPSGVMSTA